MELSQIGASPGYTFAYYGLEASLEKSLWSLDRLSELGYRNFGLEILEPEHTAIYRESNGIEQLLDRAKARGICLSSFTIWHCCTNLTSADAGRRALGVRQFEEGAVIAREFGIPLVSFGSDWPPEWVCSYRAEYQHGPAADFSVPSPEEYRRVWSGYVDAIAQCLEIAAREGVRLALEPRANSLVSSADGFLRLCEALRSRELACILDIMHCAFHREDIAVAIKKVGPLLAALQVSGTDGNTLNHLALDATDTTLRRATAALREIAFNGIVDVEIYGIPVEKVDPAYRDALRMLRML